MLLDLGMLYPLEAQGEAGLQSKSSARPDNIVSYDNLALSVLALQRPGEAGQFRSNRYFLQWKDTIIENRWLLVVR